MSWTTTIICLLGLLLLAIVVVLGAIKALTNVVNRGWQPDIDITDLEEGDDYD